MHTPAPTLLPAEPEVRAVLGLAAANSDDVVVVIRADGTIVYVNQGFVRQTGYRPEEVLGGTPRILKSGVQTDAFYTSLWRALTESGSWSGELVNRRRDGTLYTQRTRIRSVSVGLETWFVSWGQDISGVEGDGDLQQRALEFEQLRWTLATVSHDLRNMLAILVGAAYELQEDGVEGEAVDVLVDVSMSAAQLLKQVTPARPNDRATVCNVGEMAAGMQGALGHSLKGTQRLVLDIVPAPTPVALSRLSLQQILLNLTTNAARAMDADGTLELSVSEEANGMVRISARDDGCGMDAEHVRRALDPYFTTHEQGSGLGLAITQGMVRRAGGALRILSQPGEGTTVQIDLPRAR